MGNATSAPIGSAVTVLRSSPIPEPGEAGEEAFWATLLPAAAVPTLDLFAAIQPDTVREVMRTHPRNVAMVLLKVGAHARVRARALCPCGWRVVRVCAAPRQ